MTKKFSLPEVAFIPIASVMDAPKLSSKGHPEGRGTLHFAPGTKVYLLPLKSYDLAHYLRAPVAGIHRDGRWSRVWTNLKRLEGFAVESITEPKLMEHLLSFLDDRDLSSYDFWTEKSARQFADWMNLIERPDWDDFVRQSANQKDPAPEPT